MHHIDIERVRQEMAKEGLDALIAASVINVCYCTGHYSKIWASLRDHLRLAVIPKDSEPFVTCPDVESGSFSKSGVFKVFEYPIDVYFKYAKGEDLYQKARENVKDIPELNNLNVRDLLVKSPVLLASKILKERGLRTGRIGLDKEYVETAFYEEIAKAIPNCEIVDGTEMFLALRAIKSEEEIKSMIKAVRITERAMETSLPLIKEGGCLLDLHRHYSQVLSEEEGSEPEHILLQVSPIPAGQVFSSMKDQFKPGQVLRVDVGAIYNNYGADFARQWAFGEIPEEEKTIFNTILEAVDAMVEKLEPGTKISDLYWVGNKIMQKIDPDYNRRLFMGHSTGLESHERPYITPHTHDVLKPGMVMCMEVPYYAAGGHGYNAEDEYLITENGHELLSSKIPLDLVKV